MQPVVGRVLVAVLDLRLGHRRLERPVPQRRRLSLVRLPASEVVEEEPLRNPLHRLVNRRVGQRPVHRQPQIAPEVLERLLVFLREAVAQFDEVPPRNRNGRLRRLGRRLEVGIVRRRRIAPHAVVVLHPALRRQAVVVPPHRVEDLTAPHPLVSRYRVGMRIREDVSDVQRTAHRRRRRVDAEYFVPTLRVVEVVYAGAVPLFQPLRLDAVQRRLLRYIECHENHPKFGSACPRRHLWVTLPSNRRLSNHIGVESSVRNAAGTSSMPLYVVHEV